MKPALAFAMFVGLGATSCTGTSGAKTRPTQSGEPALSRQQQQLPGAYTCRFEARDETLDDASCAIEGHGDSMQLSMSGGEHRLQGQLSATEGGFRFVGEYTCSSGADCKESIETDFFEQNDGQYHGTFAVESGKLLNVTLEKR